jgi:hypothetical protein
MRKSVMVMVIVVEHISNSVNVDPLFRSIDRRELLGERDDDVIELKPENRTIHLVWSSSPSVLQFWSIKGVNNDSEDWESLVTQRVYISLHLPVYKAPVGRVALRSYSTFELDSKPDS